MQIYIHFVVIYIKIQLSLLVSIYRLRKKKSRKDETNIYETPDYIISPALPPRNDTEVEMKDNNAYSTALPPRNDSEVEMKANNAYSTSHKVSVQTPFKVKFDSSNPDHLKMVINSAYSSGPASDVH